MYQDTRPAELGEGGPSDPMADFRVTSPPEVRSLLKGVMDRGLIVNLNASDGSVYGSTLWSVDAEQRRIAFTADLGSPMVQRVVEADEVTAVAYLDKVKLQFEVSGRLLVHGRQTCVLQADWPHALYRFQRRNAYRVRTIERMAPHVEFRHPALPEMTLSLRVLDLSVNGCALFLPDNVPPLQPGVTIHAAQLQLEPGQALALRLHVHHVTAIQPDARGVRLGCEFVSMPGDGDRALQRYIDAIQKRRRMMSLD